MSGSKVREIVRARGLFVVAMATAVLAMLTASVVTVSTATPSALAQGPAYAGPQTTADGPAYFGPAPNPFPYCDNPTYFDPWEDNVTPVGRLDVGDTTTVTTDGTTLVLEIKSEGESDSQYPGFFPFNGEGASTDRAKGIEFAAGDSASLTISEPLFYAQFVFTDVDQPGEGFEITPDWAIPGEIVAYGGHSEFSFAGTSQHITFDDLDGVGQRSESVNGRVQVDMLGAVKGVAFERPSTHVDPDTGLEVTARGQSGFAVAGGCEASGAAKRVASGPEWNGTSFEVTYELRVRNNLPSEQTLLDVIAAGQANAQTSFATAAPSGIALEDLRLRDQLADPAFSAIVVTDLTTTSPDLVLNDDYNGLDDDELLSADSVLTAGSEAVISLTVEYTPEETRTEWANCTAGHDHLNQSEMSGRAGGIAVGDLSDDGVNPTPSSDNGSGNVDDPTPVLFPCLPAGLEVVKTVVNGPNGVCPTFADGVPGDGPPLQLIVGDVATYCVSVKNPGLGTAYDVAIDDPQAPGAFAVGALETGQRQTVSYDIPVDIVTPTLNVATATGTSALGDLGPVSDTARIRVSPKPQPNVQIVKTVLSGPNATCPDFDGGVPGRGAPLAVDDGDIVTYCISVRNEGPGDAVDVVISDDQAPYDYAVGTLANMESTTISYDLTVSLTTPTINVAFVDGYGPEGPFDQASDDAEIVVSPLQPALEIVKTAVAGPNGTCPMFAGGVFGPGSAVRVTDGDTVTYCVSVINSGSGIATNVVVADVQAPGPFEIGTLASQSEETVSYDVEVSLQTPDTNTATADGDGPTGSLDEVSDDAVIVVDRLPEPRLEIVKTAIQGAAACPNFAGGTLGRGAPVQFVETETVTYCLTVRNTGGRAASNVTLSDVQAPNSFDLSVGDLAVNEEVTRSYERVVSMQGESINIAFVDGDGPYGPVNQVSDDAEIAVSPQPDPVLEIVKTAVEGPNGTCPDFANGVVGDGPAFAVLIGDVVTYCLGVINSGENPAESVQVSDPQAPGVFSVGTLAVGEETVRSYDITVDAQTEPLNTATVAGVGPNGQLPDDSDTAVIDPSPQPDPVLEIVKTAVEGPNGTCPVFDAGVSGDGDPFAVFYGDVVTYCISIRNGGERPAANVLVVDEQAPQIYGFLTLEVDGEETVSYDITVDAQTEVLNTATVAGSGPNGDLPEELDTAVIDSTPQPDPQLNIVKTVVLGPDGTCLGFDGGSTGIGDALTIELGDTVTYCVSVRNTGARSAENVLITDEQAPRSFDIGTLAVDETIDLAYDVTVNADTPLVNIAVVTGDGPNGELPPDDDDAQINTASIELVHTVIRTDRACEDTVEEVDVLVVDLAGIDVLWCYRVTNIGAVPLTNIALASPGFGFFDLDVLANAGGTFAIGDSGGLVVTGSSEALPFGSSNATYGSANVEPGAIVLMPGETTAIEVRTLLPRGGLISEADVVADPADIDGNLLGLPPVTDNDGVEVREGMIQLDKTVVAGGDADCGDANDLAVVSEGDPVTWCFTVTNIGTLDLAIADIVDDTLGIKVPIPDGLRVLEPAASFTLSATGNSTGPIVNLASVEALALDREGEVIEQAPVVRDEDTAEIQVPQAEDPQAEDPRPEDPRPEYPGPFNDPDSPSTSTVPDQVLGLAITGAPSRLLALLAAAMLTVGGVLSIGSRRRQSLIS